MVTALIVAGAVVLFLGVPFGDSGVSWTRENVFWKGGAGRNPPLRYDSDARFNRPSDRG